MDGNLESFNHTTHLSLESSNHALVVTFVATHAQVLTATEKKKHQTAMCEESHAARNDCTCLLAASLMQPCMSNAAIINTFSQ